ncbi:myosin-6-like [Ptychodera flava]|uniref:myosin-6-like n=1 Tax=Ptychodera flava TaxID=63121 RepID=UPI00396A3074
MESAETTEMHLGMANTKDMDTAARAETGNIEVHVEADEEFYEKQMKYLDEQLKGLSDQDQIQSIRKKQEKLKAAMKRCKEEFHKKSSQVIANKGSQETINNNCEEHFGEAKVTGINNCSLAIQLNLPTLYNLYRLEHTCLSGSFPDSFEPLLITDKMREEADKVGLKLTLKATYDQARFNELELFFINRDGGGLKPVKVYDDVIEGKDAEEIHIDGEDTDQKSDTTITGEVADRTPTEHRQSLKVIQTKLEMVRATLESKLKRAKKEKATLEKRCEELTQKLESAEQSLGSQCIGNNKEREKLQSELEQKEKLIKELDDKLEQSELKKQGDKALEDIQSKLEMEWATLESQLKEAKGEKATLEKRCKELTQKLESTEQSLVSQRIGTNVKQKTLQSELEQKKKLINELENTVEELQYQLEQSDLKKQREKGDWSMTLVNGQHKDQGQKFKSPRGLAFHRDKLVVCDTGNNIVQILNKDYTCDKVIGSFDGQFAKPFRPLSVAISRFNHYFILDDENKQIVVCDENGKIIQIITLPENIKVVFDIALMDDFVLVTLSLTSLDISRREDRDDRLVKYTQGGEHLKEVHGQIRGQGQFNYPVSVVVNSNNVIMVYDWGNGCIKCFDSDLNFLHQFGQSQLSGALWDTVDALLWMKMIMFMFVTSLIES